MIARINILENLSLIFMCLLIFFGLTVLCSCLNDNEHKDKKNNITENDYAVDFMREPSVSGQFYPKNPEELSGMIKNFLAKTSPEKPEGRLIGIISPHAGYVYSGQVAAYSYKLLENQPVKTVILIGSSHRYPLQGASVWPKGIYRTPLGEVKVDEDIAHQLINASQSINFIKDAHLNEHSLEVQIPFLQTLLNDFKIVPLLTNWLNSKEIGEISRALSSCLNKPGVIIVSSTDLSHFHSYDQAKAIDQRTLNIILTGDPNSLAEMVKKGNAELCGVTGVILLLETVRLLSPSPEIRLLKYANSGDVSRMKDRVVGYGALSISIPANNNTRGDQDEPATKQSSDKNAKDKPSKMSERGEDKLQNEELLNEGEKGKLLKLARESIEQYLSGKRGSKIEISEPGLLEPNGAFVTLHKKGMLRGCIGYIKAYKPLNETVSDCAVSAAVKDPRFPPLQKSELPDIDIEISVLTPLKRITDIEEIVVGKHGLYIVKLPYSGLLLPQVATEYGWDRLTFLAQTCRKAGLPPDAWKKDTEIYIFSAQIFGEKGD